ncbi:MAG: Hpt domain-containing protein [Anaerolineales bacterium]|nr:Hpt domain-containing protein [Anaerolineales bacterium]
MGNQEVIDRKVLDSLLEAVGGDGEFLTELLDTYFVDSPQQFATMHKALKDNNSEEFRRAAHSLKSNSANFGAIDLSERAKNLEDLGKEGQLEQAAVPLQEAESEYTRVKSALEMIQKND